ncbi:MAG: TIGR04290 family methyltransferase [Candidatus Korobacteraceae bacterium]
MCPALFPMETTSRAESQASLKSGAPPFDRLELENQIRDLGEWFHNLDLFGIPTAPNHFLGDFPAVKWKHISSAIPERLNGATVLDIGCNGGFYSIQLKRRGAARVLGIDVDERYLNQARFAATTLGVEIEFEKRSVYQVDAIAGEFDYVFFMGVLYHLRYPLFALDKVITKIAPGGKLVFQTMLRGSSATKSWEENYQFWTTNVFSDPDWPSMYFVEHCYANDPTNWWIPNRAAAEAMLRSSGLEILEHPEPETWICAPKSTIRDGQSLLELELQGKL